MSDRPQTYPGLLDSDRVTRIEERLEHGNKSHADFRERLQTLEKRGEDRLKTVLGWVLGFVVALLGWAYSVTSKPDVTEVRRMIVTESPYLRDQPQIERVVGRYDKDSDDTRAALEAIRLELAAQGNKLDTLIRAVSQPRRGR